MAKGLYIGNSNAKKVNKIYLGNGTSHKVKKGYIGDASGKARLFYSSSRIWKRYNAVSTTVHTWAQYSIAYKLTIDYFEFANRGNDDYTALSGNKIYLDISLGESGYTPKIYYKMCRDNDDTICTFDKTTGTFNIDDAHVLRSGVAQCDISNDEYPVNPMYDVGRMVASTTSDEANIIIWGFDENRLQFKEKLLSLTAGDAHVRYQGTYENSSYPWQQPTLVSFWTYIYWDNGRGTGLCRSYYGEKGKDTILQYVSSINSDQYPNDGESGDYWYVYQGEEIQYSQGSYITEVEADEGTYPSNGRHTDGYWYVLQPE